MVEEASKSIVDETGALKGFPGLSSWQIWLLTLLLTELQS